MISVFPAETEISFKKPESCFTGQSTGSAESFRKLGKHRINVPPPQSSLFLRLYNKHSFVASSERLTETDVVSSPRLLAGPGQKHVNLRATEQTVGGSAGCVWGFKQGWRAPRASEWLPRALLAGQEQNPRPSISHSSLWARLGAPVPQAASHLAWLHRLRGGPNQRRKVVLF